MANASRFAERSRSIPIPIQRFGELTRDSGDSSSDDDGDLKNEERRGLEDEFRALSLARVAGSVPARRTGIQRHAPIHRPFSLPPKAPLLRSRGSGDRECDQPPPIELTENIDSRLSLSYGSLRESQMEGKFMDGPASYRDCTGQIHELRNYQQIRLDATGTSYLLPQLLPPQNTLEKFNAAGNLESSLGERIRQGATANNSSNNKSPTTSTLASMMQGKSPPPIPADYLPQPYQGLYDQHDGYDNAAVFSTSLTGLEVLQASDRRLRDVPSHTTNGQRPSSTPQYLPEIPLPLAPQEQPHLAVVGDAHFLPDDNEEEFHHHDIFELEIE